MGIVHEVSSETREKFSFFTNESMGWIIFEGRHSDFVYVWEKWRDGLDPSQYSGEIVFNEFIRFLGENHPDGRFGTKGHSTGSQ
jgi:hypothetical protein